MKGINLIVPPGRSPWLSVGLLLVLFVQLVTSSTVKCPGFDEPVHTAQAYCVTATGDWDMQAGGLPLLYRLLGPLFWPLLERPAPGALAQPNDHVDMARNVIHTPDRPWDTLIFPLTHTLSVPNDLHSARYPLVTGMYLLETGERLPAFAPEGDRLPGEAVPLMEVEVLP